MLQIKRLMRLTIGVAAALTVFANSAAASGTPEEACQKGRLAASASYDACQRKVFAKFYAGSFGFVPDYYNKFLPALSKCVAKYAGLWSKLQRKATGTGSTCDNPRFDTSVAGTVTDRLTGLQWEKKSDDATVHDKDNTYSLSATGTANGTVFTSFLTTLNSAGCFADQCDWRLPTVYELQTILSGSYPCATDPCIDEGTFGPTGSNTYWSVTARADDGYNWYVGFSDASVDTYGFGNGDARTVRAVRGGL